MLKRFPIRLRLFYGLGMMLLPLLLVSGMSYIRVNRMLEGLELVARHASIHLEEVIVLQDRLTHAHATWMLQLYDPVRFDSVVFEQQVELVERAFGDSHPDLHRQEKLKEAFAAARDAWQQVLDLENHGVMPIREGAAKLEAAMVAVGHLREAAIGQLETSLVEQAAVRSRVGWLFLFAVTSGGLMLLGVGLHLARSILTPLKALESGVRKLGEGDLSYRVARLSRDELGDLAHVVNQMAEKLEKSHRELESLSSRDYLTGLNNVREFYRLFHEEAIRSERYRRPFTLLLMDLDHFKQVNDRFGHQAGDLLLQAFARRLEKLVRATDHAARVGGDEFAVLLPETDIQAAGELAERIRQEVYEHPLPLVESAQLPAITVSIGMATFPVHANDADALFAAADQALYKAKHAGRNRLRQA